MALLPLQITYLQWMEIGEIENQLLRGMEERLIVKVHYKSGKVLKGWIQHFDPASNSHSFRMMVDRRYQQDIDLSNVESIIITDEPA